MLAALLLAAEMYTVKSGDTLSGIAGNAWPIVCADNHIRDCNLIYPGQVIDLNGSTAVVTAAETPSNSSPEPSSDLGGTLGCFWV
jgi:LysM repeat protein